MKDEPAPFEELPDRRRYGYKELEQKLEEHVDTITDRLQRFIIKALAAFAVLGLTSAGSLLGFGIVLKNEAQISKDIQQQRYDTLVENCVEQNEQHDRAQAAAEKVLPLESQANVKILIDELQPYVADCEDWAERRVKGNR